MSTQSGDCQNYRVPYACRGNIQFIIVAVAGRSTASRICGGDVLDDLGVAAPDAEFTVSVAVLLVLLPAVLLTTTLNVEPLSPLTVAGVV